MRVGAIKSALILLAITVIVTSATVALSSDDDFEQAEPLLDLSDFSFGEVHPAKMDIGPDRRIYFTGGTDSRAYRVDENGVAEVFAEINDGFGFTLGCQFDSSGNFYIVNGRGLYRVPASQVTDSSASLPIAPVLFFEFPSEPPPAIPMSVDIDDDGIAYVSDMGKGEIWRINTNTGEGGIWASSTESGFELLFGESDSTNFLGIPFGVVELMVGKQNRWLFFTNHERNFFGRIRIQQDGSAGPLQVLDVVPDRSALNGAFLDTQNEKFYGVTPFTNFQNGVEREPMAVRGGRIWVLDIEELEDDDVDDVEAELIIEDPELGTPTDVITGRGFGTSENEDKLFVLDGSFDTLVWPTGVLPDPDADYHAAVRVLTPGDDDDDDDY